MNRIFKERINHSENKNNMGIIEAVRQIAKEEAKEEVKEEARKEEQEKSVKIFLTNTDFSVGKIADLIGVSASFVEGIKEELQSK